MLGANAASCLEETTPPDCQVATATLTCVLLLSPVRGREGTWRTHTETFPAGDPLEAYLPEDEAIRQVTVNGAVIRPEAYATFVPRGGDEIWIWPEWGYVPGATELLIYAGISIAVGLATTAISRALFRPKPLLLPEQNTMTQPEERTYSFEGIRTAIGPGGVVPVIYGAPRTGGQLIFAVVDHAYTILDNGLTRQDKPINFVATSGGHVNVTLTNHGYTTGQSVLIQGVQGPTAVNNLWVVERLDADHFLLLNSDHLTGIRGIAYAGGGTATLYSQGLRVFQAVTTPPTLTMLIALGEGPIGAVLTHTIQINDQPIANFPGVQTTVALGTANQAPLEGFAEVRNTFADGRDLALHTPITYTTNGALSAFVLNVVWNQGLYYMNERGEKQNNGVTLRYRFAPQNTGSYSDWSELVIQADRTAPVRIGIRRESLTFQEYDIQVEMVGINQQDELRGRWQTTLESVTEFIPGLHAYPNTALLGIRAIATDQLRGDRPNITVQVQGRTVRVGSFGAAETYSSNPAWCLMDLLTHPRYGNGVADSSVDLAAFATYAAYCDQLIEGEPRHVLNYILGREQRSQQTMLETWGGSRGILLYTGGFWTPRPTRNETPTAMLSWTDSTNFRLTYLIDPDDVNVIEANFSNEENDFEQDVLTWPLVENWPATVNKQSMDLRGVTKPTRVMRALQYELNRRRFENQMLEMDCAPSALTLQIHDLFRFAHPMPGWAYPGRVQEGSDLNTIITDEDVVFQAGENYVVHVKHGNDVIETRSVINPGTVTQRHIDVASVFSAVPTPRVATWIFGRLATDGDTRTFRVTDLVRKKDGTVHLEAVIHNPSIYDEPVAEALPIITRLFNPLGPPPPLLALIATEVTRIQPSGASLRVVNLSWDVAPLGPGFATYGGASIFRRMAAATGQLGQVVAGQQELGTILNPNDPNVNFIPLAQVRGHVLDFDDYTTISGATYVYRVVPVSPLGVPNNTGAREVVIHVAGPTTPDFFPGTVQNLRLRGQPVGATEWEGRDIHFEWDGVGPSALFSETFFIIDYLVQLWSPGQLYLMRQTIVPQGPIPIQFTYTYEQNTEDQLRAGQPGPARDVQINVWARTNTGRLSLEPAVIIVHNPPPDMGEIIPEATGLFQAAIVEFQQWAKPRDFSHFQIHLDLVNPPVAIYEHEHSAFGKLLLSNLLADVTYYVYILPYDTFGPGIRSQIASFTPVSINADSLDTTPPAMPTGLALTTGADVSPDGTVLTWVQASWNANTEGDLAGYTVHFRVGANPVPTVFTPGASTTSIRLPSIGGNVTVHAKMNAFDRFANTSPFTAETSITTGVDTEAPGVPGVPVVHGTFRAIALLWTPPEDLDYLLTEVWASLIPNRLTASPVGEGYSSFVHSGLESNQTWYYWLRSRDASGNPSDFTPGDLDAFVGITIPTTTDDIGNLSITATQIADNAISTPKLQANSVTANKVTTGELITLGAQIRAAIINDAHVTTLSATKITAGTIQALVSLGVGSNIFLDGINKLISVFDANNQLRILLGRLGSLNSDYGLMLFNELGQTMWNFTTGATQQGINDGAITAPKISAATIASIHLRTDTAVITLAAQIANAIIGDAHVANLSATKLIAGTISALISVGVGDSIIIDGVNTQIAIYDLNDTLRVLLGKVGAGTTDYGLSILNELGQVMFHFSAGVSTFGIQDLAVTNAKINNLVADKILTGTLTVAIALGVGNNIILDGINKNIAIYDDNTTLRIVLGKLGAGSTDYGLNIKNAAGQDMWLLSSGATTLGITANAVTATVAFAATGGGLTNNSELQFASVTFGTLNTGDIVVIMGKSNITSDGTSGEALIRIRENNTSGTLLDIGAVAAGINGTAAVMWVYTAASTLTNKTFILSVERTGAGGVGSCGDVKLVATRYQR